MAERGWTTPLMTQAERRRLGEGFETYREQRAAADEITRAKPAPSVVEIPFTKLAAEPDVPRCCRLRTDGRQCELPAVVGDECLPHWRWYKLYTSMHGLPLPADGLSLQEMLGYAVDMVLSRRISADEGHAIAELRRIMEKNLARCERELEAVLRRR